MPSDDELLESLHPLERKVFPLLKEHDEVKALEAASGLQEVEVIRALQWLSNKKLIKTPVKQYRELAELDELGKRYLAEGLPEERFLAAAKNPTEPGNIRSAARLSEEEAQFCLGHLRKRGLISLRKEGSALHVSLTGKPSPAEKEFLSSLAHGPRETASLSKEERSVLEELKRRKSLVRVRTAWEMRVSLTPLGKELLGRELHDAVETLTSEMLSSGSWKGKRFRRYDVEVNVPATHPGKRHFVNQAIEYARRIWLDLGFREMTGPLLQPAFWNFDALFTAQDHPVRDLQDTFYIAKPARAKLPAEALVKRVQEVHENGGSTGSSGWRYAWDREEARRNVLRTHTTGLSARTLASLKELPAKYFALGVNFRNEAIDWSHNVEFNQTEGIVVDEDANFRHLLGYLRTFFRKMGYPEARFRPAYFPYTEMSVEIDVFHPVHKKWVELGGAGMFRPEVVVPLLGKDIPVLAWGPGFDRTIMEYFRIHDIRQLYGNDVKQLREMPLWMR